MKADWATSGPGLNATTQRAVELSARILNNLTIADNMLASIVTLGSATDLLTSGTEYAFAFPRFKPKAFTPSHAVDSSGAFLCISGWRPNFSRSDGLLGLTAEFGTGGHSQPYLAMTKSANQSLTTGAITPITWDQTRESNGTVISITNNSRISVSEAGTYSFVGTVSFDLSAAGERAGWWTKNGSGGSAGTRRGQFTMPSISGADAGVFTTSSMWRLAAGDYVELNAYQTSGGNLNILGNGLGECTLQVSRLYSLASGIVTGILWGG